MELKWRTPPPPAPPGAEDEVVDWVTRIVQWLEEQEREPDYVVESIISLGGPGLAERLTGFEGVITGYAIPTTTVILTAPAAGKRRIVTSLSLHSPAVTETALLQKDKGGINIPIYELDTISMGHLKGQRALAAGPIVLDAIDETLELVNTAGTADISYVGAFLEVD